MKVVNLVNNIRRALLSHKRGRGCSIPISRTNLKQYDIHLESKTR
jgi:hypothetical protein